MYSLSSSEGNKFRGQAEAGRNRENIGFFHSR